MEKIQTYLKGHWPFVLFVMIASFLAYFAYEWATESKTIVNSNVMIINSITDSTGNAKAEKMGLFNDTQQAITKASSTNDFWVMIYGKCWVPINLLLALLTSALTWYAMTHIKALHYLREVIMGKDGDLDTNEQGRALLAFIVIYVVNVAVWFLSKYT